MNWYEEWVALSQRIRGIISAGTVYAQFHVSNSEDPFRGGKELRHQVLEIFSLLQGFQEDHAGSLPPRAATSLERWLRDHGGLFKSAPASTAANDQGVLKAVLPMLAALDSEISYHLVDVYERLRRSSERAVVHLQRCIVADPETKSRWKAAFASGETACERLGAAHLLLHGIWAFKANAEGARTDLVFQEPLEEFSSDFQRSAEGLVLTEWKIARTPEEVAAQFKNARKQAERYAGGALAGVELTGYRYAVVVTEKSTPPPTDIIRGGIIYRNVAIAVDPATPSRE